MYQRNAAAYQEAEVLGTSQEHLVPLLYRHLVARLRTAADQMRGGDLEGKAESLSKASAIVYELLGSLDFDEGGELANRLAGLYVYFTNEIREIGRTLDIARLERLVPLVASLHDAWSEAAHAVEGVGRDRTNLSGGIDA